MIWPALLCALGLPAGFLLIRRIPTCSAIESSVGFLPKLSIVIPARNEEDNLPRLLKSIACQDVPLCSILVVDDGSTDRTAALASDLGASVLTLAAKPPGWTGKSWACYQGAQHAPGDVLMFLDADTYFLHGGLDRIISCWSQADDRRMALSVLPYHDVRAPYEELSLFFNILMAAGAGGFGALATPRLFGQFLLISREEYFAAGGHASVSGVILENLRLAQRLRRSGCRIRCIGGKGSLHMRMFPEGYQQMSESWAKAFVQGAADSGVTVLFLSIAWISALWSTVLLLVPPLDGSRLILALIYGLFVVQVAWLARELGTYRVTASLLYPLPLAYYCFIFGRATARRALGRKSLWKGREV